MARVVLTGQRVVLRPVDDGDLGDIEKIMAEPEVVRWWPRFDRARIRDELVGSEEPGETIYAIVVDDDQFAGIVQATEEEDPDYRSAAIDIAVGTRWHGTGIAVDALRTLARHLIDARGHHHFTIDPAAENVRAIRCYAKIGFKPVGILRRNERGPDGTFHDALLMDLIADELQ